MAYVNGTWQPDPYAGPGTWGGGGSSGNPYGGLGGVGPSGTGAVNPYNPGAAGQYANGGGYTPASGGPFAPPPPPAPENGGATSHPYTPDFTGGLLSGPGTGEQWYTQHAGQWPTSTNAQNYWQGVQGQFNTPYSTAAFNPAYQKYQDSMGSRGQGTQNAYSISGQLQQPGQGEAAAQRAGTYFGTTGTGEQYMGNLMNSGYFQQPGAAEQFNTQNQGYFTAPGQGENWVNQNGGQFMTPGAAELNNAKAQMALGNMAYGQQGINSVLKGQTNNAQAFANQAKPYVAGNSIGDEYSKYFADPLRNKSYSEQIMDTGLNGHMLDPYARAQELQTKVIRDAAAARGQFNSGYSGRLEEELGKDIGASEAQAKIGLAAQADQARNARAGTALNFSTAAAQDVLGRQNLGLNAAGAADLSQRGNLGLGLQAYNQASQEGLGKVNLGTQAASAAQQAQIDRLFKGGSLSLDAQNAGLSRMMGGANVANNAQGAGLARTMGGANIANMDQTLGMNRNMNLLTAGQTGQQLQNQRLMSGANLGLSADAADQARIQALFGGAVTNEGIQRGAFTTNSQNALTGAQIAAGADQSGRANLNDQFDMASKTQGLFQDRLRGGQSDILAAATAQYNAVAGQLDAANKQQFDAQVADINAQVASGARNEQWAEQQIAQLGQAAAALVKAQAGSGGASHF